MRRPVQLILLTALLAPLIALAGAQKYEPLSASVQAALSGAIADQARLAAPLPTHLRPLTG